MNSNMVSTPENGVFSRFVTFAEAAAGKDLATYPDLWEWSVRNISAFWETLSEFYGLTSLMGHNAISDESEFPGRWYLGAQINFAELILEQGQGDDVLIISLDERGEKRYWRRAEIKHHVKDAQSAMSAKGLNRGDRVAGYVSNVPEAVIMLLACASMGFVWTAIGSDYQPDGAVERLQTTSPALLVATPAYQHKGVEFDRVSETLIIAERLGISARVLFIGPYGDGLRRIPSEHAWLEFSEPSDHRSDSGAVGYVRTTFEEPLWVVYSSGTTGPPKAIVHGHGGVVLESLKMHGIHTGLERGKRLFWYASPSWVMWNVLVSSLLSGSSIVCYSGHPGFPNESRLLEIAQSERVTALGVSPGYLDIFRRGGGCAGNDTGSIEIVLCTGSPLSEELHAWTLNQFGNVPVCPLSGGTELVGAIVGPVPGREVIAGEMQGFQLAIAAAVWDEGGNTMEVGQGGELVITKPMPSMPLFLWGDSKGSGFHAAYMSEFAGVWRHGDWAELTEFGGVSIKGRSDATLNRNGVRFGSGEIYRCLDSVGGIAAALVVGVELGGGDYWMPLFIETYDGRQLDEQLRGQIVDAIKVKMSPRHVPDSIIEVQSIPRTITGKVAEVPVKKALLGMDPRKAANLSSLANPEALFAVVEAGLHWQPVVP